MSEKPTKKWIKGCDPFDGTPRYTFEGRDPSFTYSSIAVVITTERRRKYQWDPKSCRNFYTGTVYHMDEETFDRTDEYEHLNDCKVATEKLFAQYCELFPDDAEIGEELLGRAFGFEQTM